MHIAIFGKTFNEDFKSSIIEFFKIISDYGYKISVFKPFYDFFVSKCEFEFTYDKLFDRPFKKEDGIDLMFSIGVDGTFLESISYIGKLPIPIAGINS
jgi:NAD+ kinase